jgi:hypothetical protein
MVGLLGICVALWLLRGAIEPGPPAAAPRTNSTATRPVSSTGLPASPPSLPAAPEPAPAEVSVLQEHGAVEPCTPSAEPTIPQGYDTVVVDGITVAWLPSEAGAQGPYDDAFRPTAVAYVVRGLLTEAATLTGTPRRERLTLVVYPTRRDLAAQKGAPAGVDGFYDGGAVRLFVRPGTDIGVSISRLRRELMHAQLHATAGCLPSWFTEGLVMYFTGLPPIRQWMAMLRSPDAFDLSSLQAANLTALPPKQTERAYAESLAMIVFLIEHSGGGLPSAVQTIQAAMRESPRAGLDLWERMYPGAGHRAVLDTLARKIFGVPLGAELDGIFKGTICCHGLSEVTELRCRGTARRSDQTSWFDRTSSPHDLCDTTW